jgi:hypothetical protein
MRELHVARQLLEVDGVHYDITVRLRPPGKHYSPWAKGRFIYNSIGYAYDVPYRPQYSTQSVRAGRSYMERVGKVSFELTFHLQSKVDEILADKMARAFINELIAVAGDVAATKRTAIQSSHEEKHLAGVIAVVRGLEDASRRTEISIDGTKAAAKPMPNPLLDLDMGAVRDALFKHRESLVNFSTALSEVSSAVSEAKSALSYTQEPREVAMTAEELAEIDNLANPNHGAW